MLFLRGRPVRFTWSFTMLFSFKATRLLTRLCHKSMVHGTWKGFKRWHNEKVFSRLSLFVQSVLISLTLQASNFSVSGHSFCSLIAVPSYCCVIGEADMKLLQMICWVGSLVCYIIFWIASKKTSTERQIKEHSILAFFLSHEQTLLKGKCRRGLLWREKGERSASCLCVC